MVKEVKSLSVIKRPVITEKSTSLSANNQVVFMVDVNATKPIIKLAVEDIFGVKVKKVNVINGEGKFRVFRGYVGKKGDYKKAIVTLEAGQTIDLAAGIK
jgi:large subunit ribosomal protein L23